MKNLKPDELSILRAGLDLFIQHTQRVLEISKTLGIEGVPHITQAVKDQELAQELQKKIEEELSK